LPGEEVAKLYAVCARGVSQGAAQTPTELYPAFLELARRSPLIGFGLLVRALRWPDGGILPQAQRLREWIEQYAPQFGVSEPVLVDLRDKVERETRSQVYVVVKIVENQLKDDTFYVEAWSWRASEGFRRLEIKSRLSAEDHQKFPDIETLLRAAICEVSETIAAASLLIEIITERKVFAKDISAWKVDVGDAEGAGDLLTYYPVIFRWKNRHERPRRHQYWPKKWESLKKLSEQVGLHGLKWLNCETACSHTEIINGWVDEYSGVCLALGYKPSEQIGNEDLLEAALNVGTPIVFWMQWARDGETITKELFEDLLGGAKLIDLPAHIWKLRKEAYQNPDHPARRLTLLFDDADRVLPRAIGQQR